MINDDWGNGKEIENESYVLLSMQYKAHDNVNFFLLKTTKCAALHIV